MIFYLSKVARSQKALSFHFKHPITILRKDISNSRTKTELMSKDLFIKNRTKHSSKTLLNVVRFFLNKSLLYFGNAKIYINLIKNNLYSNAYADWMSIAMIALCLNRKVTNLLQDNIFSSKRNMIMIVVFIRLYGILLLLPTNFGVSIFFSA